MSVRHRGRHRRALFEPAQALQAEAFAPLADDFASSIQPSRKQLGNYLQPNWHVPFILFEKSSKCILMGSEHFSKWDQVAS